VNHPRLLRILAVSALAALAAACASKSKHSEKPAQLTDFESTVKVERVWSADVGSSAPKLRLGLSLAVDGEAVFAANHDGRVFAYSQASGKLLWNTATKLELTGGPGAGEGLVVVGASHGNIVALDAATGAVKWKSYVNSEILAAPVISKQVVVLRAVDGQVVALRAGDGTQMWSSEQQPPRLSLRGTARPTIVGDLVLCGFDNGRLLALQLANGGTVWDVVIAPSSGKTELERLNDIDSQIVVQGKDVYVVTFQGKVARVDLETGETQWSRDASSYSGLAADADGIYISTSDGSLLKLGNRNSLEQWKQTSLSHRRLSPPVLMGDLVAVGDLDGYVHFFNRATGDPTARVHVLSERVTAAPVLVGETLFVLDASGHIAALRATTVEAGKGTVAPAGSAPTEDRARSTHPR
jgi:outer membrane protein assembly factor BamB